MATKECKNHSKGKRCAEEKRTNLNYFSYLPDDLLLCILMLLPSKLLTEQLKYVCKRWYNLITTNIDQAYLIIQNPHDEDKYVYTSRLVNICEERKISNSTTKDLNIPCRGQIKSWCKEILLIIDPNKIGSLFVYNLVTKKGSTLPRGNYKSLLLCEAHVQCKCGLSLAFNKFTQEYYVVHVYIGCYMVECEILVFKCKRLRFWFSKWERIEGPRDRGKRIYFWDDPVSVEGRFLYWDVHSCKYIVSMDIVERAFRKTLLPGNTSFSLRNGYRFMEINGFLSIVIPFCGAPFEVWLLRDFQESVWEKLCSIHVFSDVPSNIPPYCDYVALIPIASLRNGSNIIFRERDMIQDLYAFKASNPASIARLHVQIESKERCVVQSKDRRLMAYLDG